ncbi:MAG: IS481 family transposase [Ilumatobacteraceae bacterium]|nr:IS481 family transposase [Acidimicrobiaceae bacterium]MBK9972902.1 IS481 family transposase [Acidimicrobiaceae bacterium]MBP6486972.1 IS481 family transposase [Ilumatobacteraceae bacterium]MBP8208208.1 IS481 family transposase [Ilumatobacteraceae bacterium]HQZ11206.1 IS481 family transposase [Ornithinibacter sp.]
MLVELNVVEQRYQAVLEVLHQGATVTDVARRNGVTRQTVHSWLRRYASQGLAGLADGSAKPLSCPHQMTPEVEARVVTVRREHPGWGQRTIQHQLGKEGVSPLPTLSSIYRCLVRHRLITPTARKRKRDDYRRWERSRAMELWQMDIVGGVRLVDGSEAKIVSGVDDHSRFCISAHVVARATARPTCDALALAMRRHGVPAEILTDNGKVFTGRFGPGTGEVLFDRICRENGIKHILTRPRSPTTTGKIERWHKTMRVEFMNGKVFADIADAQAQLDVWVEHYNHVRPHQSLGMATPWDRFKLARNEPARPAVEPVADPAGMMPPSATRRVASKGTISFASAHYKVGVWLAGQNVEVVCEGGLVQIHHRGVLIATHARRHDPAKQSAGMTRSVRGKEPQARPTASVVTVTRKVDSSGNVSFAGACYRAGNKFRHRQVQVAVVGEHLEISIGEQLIRRHKIKHDRTREHGALANPGGRPRRINAA